MTLLNLQKMASTKMKRGFNSLISFICVVKK